MPLTQSRVRHCRQVGKGKKEEEGEDEEEEKNSGQ
jgi:hypothetical protein